MDTSRGAEADRRGSRAFDLLILVALSAFGLAWCRAWAGTTPEFFEYAWSRPVAAPHSWLLRPTFDLRRWMLPVLGPLSVGLLACWLRPPRPTRADLLSKPGMVACLVASAVTVTQWGVAVLLGALTESSAWWYIESRVFYDNGAPGMAVALAWGLLLLIRRWRPSSGWRDRAGRLIGAAWILVWALSLLLMIYPHVAPTPAGWDSPVAADDGIAGGGALPESGRRRGPHRDAEAPADAPGMPPLEPSQSPNPPKDEP